jgi:hypothetical protein
MKRRVSGLLLSTVLAAAVISGCKKPGPASPDPVPTPTPTPSPSTTGGLSGTWIGLVAEGMGSTVVAPYDGSNPAAGNCTIQSDVEVTLTQAGDSVSGTATQINRVNCPERGRVPFSDVVRHPFTATLSRPDTIVVGNVYEFDQIPLTGTYSATLIDASSRGPHPNGGIRSYALRLRKR